jgi:hypothetical protein
MVCPFSVANIQIFFQLATFLPHLFVVFVAGGHFNGSFRMDISGARALSGLWLGGAPLGQRVLLMGPRCQRPVAGAHAFTQLMKLVVAADVPSSSAVCVGQPPNGLEVHAPLRHCSSSGPSARFASVLKGGVALLDACADPPEREPPWSCRCLRHLYNRCSLSDKIVERCVHHQAGAERLCRHRPRYCWPVSRSEGTVVTRRVTR